MKKVKMLLLLFIAYTVIIGISSALCVYLTGLARVGAIIILAMTIITAASAMFKKEEK